MAWCCLASVEAAKDLGYADRRAWQPV